MKPKHQVYCPMIGRAKLVFESKKKAEKFIELNKLEIQEENGYAPIRTYNCVACGGWHTTSKKHAPTGVFTGEKIIEAYTRNHKRSVAFQVQPISKSTENLIESIKAYISELNNQATSNQCSQNIFGQCQKALQKLKKMRFSRGVDLYVYSFELELKRLQKHLQHP